MKRFPVLFVLALVLVFALVASAQPALADTGAGDPCSQVEFYIYNALGTPVFYDLTNWSIWDRVLGYIYPGEEHRILFDPGGYELWLTDYEGFYGGKNLNLPACSHVAIYLKYVNDEPAMKVRVILPEAVE